MGTTNMQKLGKVLSDRMKQTSNAAVPTTIELGIINSNLSLTPDSLQAAIPKGDYMVNLMLTGSRNTSEESHSHSDGAHGGHESGNGAHSHSGGSHSHALPSAYRGLQAGDRVLLVWCGSEPVVVAIVTSS